MILAGPTEALSAGAMAWYRTKMFVEHAIFFSSDALHVLVGMVAWIGIAWTCRRPLSDWRPWLAVLVLLVLNECVDLWVERWPDLAMQYGESAKDLLLTMILPTLVMVLVRSTPRLFSAAGGRTRRRRRGSGG
jgi:hypothetical protein